MIAQRDPATASVLLSQLFWGPTVTETGRIRGRVPYTAARNTPFQGLAADGAKLALWRLIRAGYRVIAFVHDEVLIELPVDANHAAEARKIDQIMCQSMQEFTGAVPIQCEYACAKALAHSRGGRVCGWSAGAVGMRKRRALVEIARQQENTQERGLLSCRIVRRCDLRLSVTES